MATRSFPGTLTGMMAAYLIWAVHFGAIYGFNGLVCARGWDGAELLGLPMVPVVVSAATVAALVLTGMVLWLAVRGGGPAARASEDPRRFVRWFTAASAGAALIAILWNGLPALQVTPCG